MDKVNNILLLKAICGGTDNPSRLIHRQNYLLLLITHHSSIHHNPLGRKHTHPLHCAHSIHHDSALLHHAICFSARTKARITQIFIQPHWFLFHFHNTLCPLLLLCMITLPQLLAPSPQQFLARSPLLPKVYHKLPLEPHRFHMPV